MVFVRRTRDLALLRTEAVDTAKEGVISRVATPNEINAPFRFIAFSLLFLVTDGTMFNRFCWLIVIAAPATASAEDLTSLVPPLHCAPQGCGNGVASDTGFRLFELQSTEPLWSARGGWISMTRDGVSGGTLVQRIFQPFIPNPPRTTVPIITNAEFDFDYESGFEVELARKLGRKTALAGRYLQLSDHTDNITAGPVNPVFAPLDGIFIPTNPLTEISAGAFVNNSIDVSYQSQLDTFDIRLQHEVFDGMIISVGYRHWNFDERLRFDLITVTQNPLRSQFEFETENRLDGIQLGIEGVLLRLGDRLTIDGRANAGVYRNSIDSTIRGSRFAGTARGSQTDRETAFTGELGLFGNYRIWNGISLRAGYQLLWLDNVAIAVDQVRRTGRIGTTTPVTTRIQADSDVLYHGANASLVWEF